MVTQKINARSAHIVRTIKSSWKRSVESLIEVGCGLHELKSILDRPTYLKVLSEQLSMSEMHANRIEHLYLKFHDKKSIQVLSSKPSVLYLLASSVESKKIESLAKGGKVKVGDKYKALSQFTINDVHLMREAAKPTQIETNDDEQDDDDRDLERASNAHRRLSSLVEELSDWSEDLIRYQQYNIQIKNKHLIRKYVQETILCLRQLDQLLS